MKFYFIPYHIVKDKIRSIIENNKGDFEKHYGDVEVDYDEFETLSALGMAYVSLMVENDVIGFAGFIIHHNATHRGAEAQNVVFYIDKAHRGKHFNELLEFSKKEVAKLGVPKITVTINSDSLARALRQNEFKKEYEIWELEIE